MTRVAINQSNYIPWKGYFDLMHDVDLFLFYDDVQYTTRDWRNRNRVKTPQGPAWLTVPVGSDTRRRICDVRIEDTSWQTRHWRTLCHSYARAPFFAQYAPVLEEIYLRRTWHSLSELNQFLIMTIARDFLGFGVRMGSTSDYAVTSSKQERILDLLRAVGATSYHSGPAAKAYLDADRFAREGIALVWKDYSGYPEYAQLHPPFDHAVTVLDLLFHTGPVAADHIWGWRNVSSLARARA